jgi:ADP-ribosyl-[dinitrogen reductase] hydrolase
MALCLAESTSFEHGALLAVNLGDDADTTGAVYGQIAGAFYGADTIPERWRSKLARLETLESFAMRLMKKGA